MYLLLTDETNLLPRQNVTFFIYGGLFFPADALPGLHNRIAVIRAEHGYRADDTLKFDTHSRPRHVSQSSCTEAKRQVVGACQALGCRFIAYVIHHGIATGDDLVLFAANTVISNFNRFLRLESSEGICVIDSLPVEGQKAFLEEKFTRGLRLSETGTFLPLDRIKLFGASYLGASHAASAVDIVLGSFRYCVNNPQNRSAASEMMRQVLELMWGDEEGRVGNAGLVLRPREVRADTYREDYEALTNHLGQLLGPERSTTDTEQSS